MKKEKLQFIEILDKLWSNFDKSYPEDYPQKKEVGFNVGFKDGYQYAIDDVKQRLKKYLTPTK